jgi:hypothetical protein
LRRVREKVHPPPPQKTMRSGNIYAPKVHYLSSVEPATGPYPRKLWQINKHDLTIITCIFVIHSFSELQGYNTQNLGETGLARGRSSASSSTALAGWLPKWPSPWTVEKRSARELLCWTDLVLGGWKAVQSSGETSRYSSGPCWLLAIPSLWLRITDEACEPHNCGSLVEGIPSEPAGAVSCVCREGLAPR